MTQANVSSRADIAAKHWEGQDVTELLAESAAMLPAISPTEAGTRPRAMVMSRSEHESPINLGGGIPDPASLPVEGLRAAINKVMDESAELALRYGGIFGFEELRQVVAERQGRIQGIELSHENFLMTQGGSGGIDAVCDTFLNPGDVCIAERPNFAGSLRTIRGHLCEIVEAELGDDDAFAERVDETLERLAAQGKRAKLLYTVPDHHNPTGATMPLAVREKLVEVCARHRVFIMEDMAYTELYFDAPPPPSLYAVADGHGVIQVGSFSKIIATGLRVGWVQARLPVIESLGRVRFDMGGSPLLHRALAHYAGSGDLETHVEELRGIYRRKCATLVSSLRENCHPHLRFEEPAGGFFLWAECVGASAQDVAREASEEGLVFAMGSNFFKDREAADTSHLRLALSYASVEELEEAGPRFQRAFERAVG